LQRFQVRVFLKVPQVRKSQPDRPLESCQGLGGVAGKDIAASEIIVNDRIILTEEGQPFVDLKTFFEETPACVGLCERGQGVDVIGAMLQDPFKK